MIKRALGVLLVWVCISQGIVAYAHEGNAELVLPEDEVLQVAPGELEIDDSIEKAGSAKRKGKYLLSDNAGLNDYFINWSNVVGSYLTVHDDGSFTRIEYAYDGNVYIEDYSKDFVITGNRKISLELPIFGGFYDDGTNYYLVFGQKNYAENDNCEVYRIVKYSHSWERLDSASVYGANTTVPFDAGSLRFDDYGGYLYIRTCHEMYTADDGYNHQANVTMRIKISNMNITDIAYGVQNRNYGYISHSFNQFIKVDNGKVYALDHGDALPRTAVLSRYDNTDFGTWDCTTSLVDTITYADYKGYHYNYTGATLGGFEISDYACLTAGSSAPQDGVNHYRNVYVTATDKNKFSQAGTKLTWVTNKTDTAVDVGNPQLVEIHKNSYLLLWMETGYTDSTLKYLRLDGKGNPIGNVVSCDGLLSDCQPIFDPVGKRVVWYVTDGYDLTFYSVYKWKLNEKHLIRSLRDIKVSAEEVNINAGEKVDLNITYVPADTTDDTAAFWRSSNTSIAKVDQSGVVTAVNEGSTIITVMVGDFTRYINVEVKNRASADAKNWPFTDVAYKPGNWKYDSIKYVYDNKIMNGVGDGTRFDPDAPLTREMFATVLYRMAGEPAVTYKNKFPDVPGGKWYSNAVIWASEQGIVSGYGSGNFGTGHYITREQIAKMFMEYGRMQGYNISQRQDFNNFADAGKVSSWAKDYMKWAVGSGMIGGSQKNGKYYLNPNGNATRAECATMLQRFIEKY